MTIFRQTSFSTLAAMILAAVALSGCGFNYGQKPDSMGLATDQALMSQKLDPEAGGDAPVMGLDGQAAAKILDDYRGKNENPNAVETDAVKGLMTP